MSSKVGIRVYQVTVHRERDRKAIAFNSDGMSVSPYDFVSAFIARNSGPREVTQEETEQNRRWYFESRQPNMGRSNKGILHYGISGFESDLVDEKTNKKEFRRRTNHIELIPLFYEFWFPAGFNHAFAVFQSFSSRSCVALVSGQMRTDFNFRNPGFTLNFKKLLPVGRGGLYDSAPVKGLRLIRRNASADIADRYLKNGISQAVDLQISINARRKGMLGKFGDIFSSMKAANGGVIQHDGVIFDEAVAEIDFGGQRRRVGMLGSNSEAGVIDLSDIRRASDGHPDFESIAKESTALLADFQAVIGRPA